MDDLVADRPAGILFGQRIARELAPGQPMPLGIQGREEGVRGATITALGGDNER